MKIGVLGGGQLGRMLALAGFPLGFQFRFFDTSPEAPSGQLAELVVGSYEDMNAFEHFAEGLDLVTYEFENVPVASARSLAERVTVYPPPQALEVSQDRLSEKSFFQSLGIPTPRSAPVDTRASLEDAVKKIKLPVVLKTQHMGYDGKGQFVLHDPKDIGPAWKALSTSALIVEEFVPFERELSILAVRGRNGQTAFYPLIENHHDAGILRLSLAPAPRLTAELQTQAEHYATSVLEVLNYVGVLAIEFFEFNGKLLANEMAPRVHNSGHWTIEGAQTSQFENHLRAIAGFPLGSTEPVGHSAMLNLIGTVPDMAKVLSVPRAHLHLYGKAPRPGRKLGHVTLCAPTREELEAQLEEIKALVQPL